MPQVANYDLAGKEIGAIDLAESVFTEKINENVVHQVLIAQLAAIRRGTASTKTRSEVRGGGRKPWRQKGTGRARAGTIRSPLWVGGGTVFGPKPRDYQKKISKKVKKLALRSILTDKFNREEIIVLDDLVLNTAKTKELIKLLNNFHLEGQKVLIVIPEKDRNIYLSARNIPKVKTLVVAGLNAYDLLNNDKIIVLKEALVKIEEVLTR